MSPEWKVLLLSASPIFELRGGIPLALTLNFPLWKAYILAVLGNMLPVIPLLLFLDRIASFFEKTSWGRKFFHWLFERTRRKAKIVERMEALGLALFVAIPLPVTGAWTGSVAATIFRIKFKLAIISILGGVLLAGIIVSLVTYGGKWIILKGGLG